MRQINMLDSENKKWLLYKVKKIINSKVSDNPKFVVVDTSYGLNFFLKKNTTMLKLRKIYDAMLLEVVKVKVKNVQVICYLKYGLFGFD